MKQMKIPLFHPAWHSPVLTALTGRGSHTPCFRGSFLFSCQCKHCDEYPRLLKPDLSRLPRWARTACLQLRLPGKLCCNPSVTPWSNRPGRLAWSWPIHPCAEGSRPRSTGTRNAEITVKHPKSPIRGQAPQLFLLDHVLGTAGHTRCCSIKPCKKHSLNLSWLLMDQERICCWCSNPAEHLLLGPHMVYIYGYIKSAGLLTSSFVLGGSLLSLLAILWSCSASQGCNRSILPLTFGLNRHE